MRWAVILQSFLRIRQLATAALVQKLGLSRFMTSPEKEQHMLDCLELYRRSFLLDWLILRMFQVWSDLEIIVRWSL
jgi:hypothetical protein